MDVSSETPVFIIGYMACGKTTFGRALARTMGRDFIDLDFYIEQRFRLSIRDIFAQRGEVEFRRMEAAMLREVGEFSNVVVACGGGTPCHAGNMDYMLGRGLTVWLQASEERTVARLMANNARRPLMAGKSEEEIRVAVRDANIMSAPPSSSPARNSRTAARYRAPSTHSLTCPDFPLRKGKLLTVLDLGMDRAVY